MDGAGRLHGKRRNHIAGRGARNAGGSQCPVEVGALYAIYNIPHINQVYILFRARMLDTAFKAGAETLEARLFAENEIPWEQLAFATVRNTLTHYYSDRRHGEYKFHMGTIEPVRKT